MGVFDSILGTNTTSAQDAATQSAISNLTATGKQNVGVLRGTTDRANGALQVGAQNASDALNAGYGAATGALTNYGQQAQDALRSGTNEAVGTIQGSNANYAPYATSGGVANTMLANSLGLNGASGNTAATNAFQAGPGYQWQVDQATDAAARKAASLGIAGSGNTLDAITRLGSNLANQEYGNWQSNLSGLAGEGLTAASGISSNNQAAGGVQANAATTGANLLQSTGSGLATLDAGQGTGQAALQSGLGSALSGNFTNLGTGIANTNMGTALQSANLGVADAQAQDTAANTDSGIFSKLIGTTLGLPLGAATTTAASTPGFTITPTAPASTSNGIFSSLINKATSSLKL